MSLTNFMLGFDDNHDYCPCRPRSKSIGTRFVFADFFHALGRCSRRLVFTRLLAKFRMEFTDEARRSARNSRVSAPREAAREADAAESLLWSDLPTCRSGLPRLLLENPVHNASPDAELSADLKDAVALSP
jgi:hypothetical protein